MSWFNLLKRQYFSSPSTEQKEVCDKCESTRFGPMKTMSDGKKVCRICQKRFYDEEATA